ncbi:serine hydrolase [Pseudoalteromonas sp. bablab_jr011]|uniref:serine hydrolase domain-containing protein n=1 Tax=Pseudoalteromonas sp. bablab_jr011 TaxID=2755062 RepID=UPI0018F7AF55|nr:serine hydrolase domain-containing protein [Pseudoalteromonas sp. bablab_jr011]
MNKLLFFIVFFVISNAQAADATYFSELKAELDQAVPKILDKHKAPGVAVAFVQGEEVTGFLSYGFADIESQKAITENTMFNVGSISKVVTSWGVMQLVDQGKVELDKPINNYLKRWKIPKSEFGTENVTLRNVLSHTSGLSLGPYSGWGSPTDVPSIVDSLNGKNNGAGDVKIIHTPNTKWSYSGGGYSIVQLLIEDVSGLSFEDYMQKNVLKPLGMNNSTFNVTPAVMSKSATPYDENAKKTSMIYFAEQAAAGLQTTAIDLARFNLAVLKNKENKYNGSRFISQALIKEMITPVANTGGRWSMSYVVDSENKSLGFAGFNQGWIALTRSITDQNRGYVILTNSSIGSVSNDIDSLILSKLRKPKSE